MSLNDVMARLAQDKPKPQTNEQIKQTELQTKGVLLNLDELDYALIRTSLHYLLHGIIRSKLHPKDKNKRITAINELLCKLKTQHLQ